jgi:hypothetical protein
MVEWGYNFTIRNLDTRYKLLINFTFRPLYRWGNNLRYKLHRKLGRPQSLSAGNRTQFLGLPACSLVSIPNELFPLTAGVIYYSFEDRCIATCSRQHSCLWFRAPSGLVSILLFVPRPFICFSSTRGENGL